jgi:sec-independent protein translocase protein TatA
MPNIGLPEMIIILLVVLLLFGTAKLPKLARSLGQAQKEFKQGLDEGAKDEPGPNPGPKDGEKGQ